MPFRMNEFRAHVHFITAARHPSLIRKAATKRGLPSNTVYIQHAVCAALSKDLGIPMEELLDELPANRLTNPELFGTDKRQKKSSVQ